MSVSSNNRQREPGKAANDQLILAVALTINSVVAIVWMSVAVGSKLDAVNAGLPSDPFEILAGLACGTVTWSGSATVVAVLAVAGVALTGGWSPVDTCTQPERPHDTVVPVSGRPPACWRRSKSRP